jgi:hypothetical protein
VHTTNNLKGSKRPGPIKPVSSQLYEISAGCGFEKISADHIYSLFFLITAVRLKFLKNL